MPQEKNPTKTSVSSLTRDLLLSSDNEPTVEKVDNVPGLGTVFYKKQSEMQSSRRLAALYSGDEKLVQRVRELRRIHLIIDCICNEDGTPMFTEADAGKMLKLKEEVITPLYLVATEGEVGNGGTDESSDTSMSSSETTD